MRPAPPPAARTRIMLSVHDWRSLADAVALARDLERALGAIVDHIAEALKTRAVIVQRVRGGWRVVAQAPPNSLPDLPDALNAAVLDERFGSVDLTAVGQGVWTSMFLSTDTDAIALLVEGEPTTVAPALSALRVWLPFTIGCLQQREQRGGAERLVAGGYKMARRVARGGDFHTVCRHVVEQVARSTRAERVAIAAYRADEDRLAVVATHGYPAATVESVRIVPGSWVMGHVYASRRPVVVRDVRQIGALSLPRRAYRTFSFAVVPIVAGGATLGVLSATDKEDGSSFTRDDTLALRSFGAIAALGMMSARSDAEVRRLAHVATFDSLTGLFNRPSFEARLHQEVERAKRESSSLTMLIGDVDDFKSINDSYGHPVGDAVLQAIGNILRSAVRVFDVCARYGGDEFAILMPSSDPASAIASAERIRQRVSEWHLRDEALPGVGRLTMSIGVAVLNATDSATDLVRRADECLYRAKGDGKNCVRTATLATPLRGGDNARENG